MTCLVVAATLARWTAVRTAAFELLVNLQNVAAAESMPVPAELQVGAILTALTYDRNFTKRGWTVLNIGIVFAGSDPASSKVRSDIVDAFKRLSDKTVRNLPINPTVVEYMSDSQFESVVKASQFNVLYIAPGNARNLPKLLQVSQSQRIITVTGVPEYVRMGVAVGIGPRLDKSEVLINLPSSRAAGSEFDASLLSIAKVIK